MANRLSSAVVLGASMSGLLAARTLSPHFERITVVERDVLPTDADLRKGVPQAAHAHGLLASGYRLMDAYFPGMMDELDALGAPRGDVVGDFLWFLYGGWKLRHHSGLRGITVSRPCLEAAIRRRVKARPPGFAVVNRYLERVHAVASEDAVVCRKFFDVLNLLATPTSLLSPRLAWRVLARPAPKGESSPWGFMAPVRASARRS